MSKLSNAFENNAPSKMTKDQAWVDIKQRMQCETCKEVVDHFTKTVDRYEETMQIVGYHGPEQIAGAIEMLAKDRSDLTILDVGAGTGLIGAELAKRGYTKLDAIDASDVLLERAANKNVYRKLICHYVGGTPMPVDDDSYDMLVTGGVFAPNTVPFTALDDFVRVVRTGGHVINLTWIRKVDWFSKTFEGHMIKLEEQKKWKLISKTIIPEYIEGCEGSLYIHTIL